MSLVWITGARGFIGRHLSRYLSDQDNRVIGIGHGFWSESRAADWGLSAWIESSVSMSSLIQLGKDYGVPDQIFHLAGGSSVGPAFINPYEDFTRTVVTTGELLEWQRQHSPNSKLIVISSAAVYGAGHHGPIAENANMSPFSPYGAHKLMMEELCRSYATNFGLKIVIPRLFSVYGTEIKKQFFWDLCGKLSAGKSVELGGTGNELRDWTHISDVVRALEPLSHIASEKAPTLNLATGIATSIHDIATDIASYWGGASAANRIRFSGQSRAGDPFSLVADTKLIRSHGIECRFSLMEGVSEYVDWYQGR